VRYRIGDLGRWVDGECPCGRPGARFELLGRVEERFSVGGCVFQYGEIQAVVEAFAPLHSSPQVVITGGREDQSVRIRAELVTPDADASALASAVDSGLRARVPAFASPALSWAVEVVAPGSLERVGRTGKIVRILDHRKPTPKADV
jgi:phenylacetate-coenzyme A ligase PaaK-like adenylate-forming protein